MKTSLKVQTLALLTGLISVSAIASTIPDGTYTGQALWKSRSQQGNYAVQVTVAENTFQTEYSLPDGTKKQWDFEMAPEANGFFKVKTHEVEVGSGYCLEKSPVCHYQVKIADLSLEETLTVQEGKLYRFGSKQDGTGQILWQESLDKSADKIQGKKQEQK